MNLDTRFLDELASSAPTPGGGGASAYGGALAAAAASMVGNLTLGKKKYADVQDEVQATLERLEVLRKRLLELVEADAEAFKPVAAVYRMPQGTPEEKAAREAAMQVAVVGAIEVPLEIMTTCAGVMQECRFLAYHGSRLALSDVAVAVEFARAAAYAASYNVDINLNSLSNVDQVKQYETSVEEILSDLDAKADILRGYIKKELRG